ncbi:Cytochrome P450 regulator dap1 [Cladophialophora carrionii]|uniref:Cytochrome P450 regulator dap1 n=1 Tax=Cladophialophora carrionii TaxID=86049 RepID=A0A1C1CF74_9EURO|nr:Cytochrome P450 regulator dap1 [Cladophialophora carrionii]
MSGIPPARLTLAFWRQSFAITTPLLTPLNLTLLVLILTLIYLRLRPSSAPSLPAGPPPIVFKTFTPRTLLKYNGTENAPVYLAVRGKVYDVSSGRNFYGPGGPYENFAGRDATRGLACQSFDEEMLTKDLDGPLDPCEDLTSEQVENLNGWIERFDEKGSWWPSTRRTSIDQVTDDVLAGT